MKKTFNIIFLSLRLTAVSVSTSRERIFKVVSKIKNNNKENNIASRVIFKIKNLIGWAYCYNQIIETWSKAGKVMRVNQWGSTTTK